MHQAAPWHNVRLMSKKPPHQADDTRVTTLGRDPHANFGVVNAPVYHASTILYPNYEDLRDHKYPFSPYGRMGTPGTNTLEVALAELEGAHGCRLCPSGLNAVVTSLLSVAGSGEHVLMADNVYEPIRMAADSVLKRMGLSITYFDPCDPLEAIAAQFTATTKAVFAESPGSLTFEVMDIPALADLAHDRDAVLVVDNTWGTPLHFKAFQHGADISVHACTKYVSGHSDVMLGAINYSKALAPRVEKTFRSLGLCAAPDDVYLALRGLRTMAVRLERHAESAVFLAHWLTKQPGVARVLNPMLPGDPGHKIWARDFLGGNGLFGVELVPGNDKQLAAFFNSFELFGLGFSWGGFESLAVPGHWRSARTVSKTLPQGPLVRLHVGLENVEDLRRDLEKALTAYNAAAND